MFSRRAFLASTALGTAYARGAPVTAPGRLSSLTADVAGIPGTEYQQRLARLQSLLQQSQVAALLVEAGSSLEYFTGIQWWRSERTTAAVIPALGDTVVVTPYFESPSVSESLKITADVRTWKEDASPFELIAAALRERAKDKSRVAVESTTRYFIVEGVRQAANSRFDLLSGEPYVRACRMKKSAAELALMQAANNVTMAAIRHAHAHVSAGMRSDDVLDLIVTATTQLGGAHEFTLVLLNEASAFPHGSRKPQVVRDGSVILVDTGCAVHGYQSDISRTWFHGAPSARQRELWNTVRRGQDIALQTAKPGVAAGEVDRAVRAYYEEHGWSKDYLLPGLSHRTGHGIGMDVHEPPYLVRNDLTPLEPGMCFSDEPGLYVPGEFGVRLEDYWYLTATGPKLFTALAQSPEHPI